MPPELKHLRRLNAYQCLSSIAVIFSLVLVLVPRARGTFIAGSGCYLLTFVTVIEYIP